MDARGYFQDELHSRPHSISRCFGGPRLRLIPLERNLQCSRRVVAGSGTETSLVDILAGIVSIAKQWGQEESCSDVQDSEHEST